MLEFNGPVKNEGLHEPVSNLNKLFLGKPPGDSLQVFSVHSFANNYHLALLESVEDDENCAQVKNR